MGSPFQRVAGTFKSGEHTYEWLSLLQTPCYGFNGPNACYDASCLHDGATRYKKEQPKQQFVKQKSTSKFLLRLNVRATSGMECDGDGSNISSGQEHMVFSETYSGPSSTVSGAHLNFDSRSIRGLSAQQFFTATPTIEVNFHVESPNTMRYLSSLSSKVTTNGYISSGGGSGVGISKKYVFNPLSKPFHPMKKNSQLVVAAAPSDVVSCAPPPAATIATTTAVKATVSVAPAKASPTNIDSVATGDDTAFAKIFSQPSKYVCLLCPKTFSTAAELQQHIESKAKQPHDCVICGQTFTHGYQLQRHLWIHLKNHRRIRPFNCRACHKKFRSLNQLHKHYELCQYKLYIFF